MKQPNFQETKSARVIQVIETVSLAGDGTDTNPVYEVHQWTAICWQRMTRSVRMTFILLLLVNNEDFPVQFFTLVSGNVPVFQKQFQ